MFRTACERVAAPLVELHRRTTPPVATVILALVGAGLAGYGVTIGHAHLAWAGALVVVVGWYGFLLSGCERLLAAKERELQELRTAAVTAVPQDRSIS